MNECLLKYCLLICLPNSYYFFHGSTEIIIVSFGFMTFNNLLKYLFVYLLIRETFFTGFVYYDKVISRICSAYKYQKLLHSFAKYNRTK